MKDPDPSYDQFELRTLTPHIGAEIRGLDLSQPLDDGQALELERAFLDKMVLVFRDQHLTPRTAQGLRTALRGSCTSIPWWRPGIAAATPRSCPS